MNTETLDRRARRRTLWMAVTLFFVVTIGGVIVRRIAGPNAALAMAYTYGAGMIAMAWLTARTTQFPRWAWFTTAGVMTLGLVGSAMAYPGARWVEEWQGTAWMFPWLFLVMSGTGSARKTGWCAPSDRRAGALLVGMAALFTLLLAIPFLTHRA